MTAQPEPFERASFAPAQWLRWLGALSFVGAGASFLVEGWTDPGIIKRQALWAAGTLIMTLLGVVVARRLRDAIGARVFLGLAAATIPAHFAQLGSALYDLRASGTTELGSVLIAGAITLSLLPPLALGMSALIRRRARTLSVLMFAFAAPLVIPTRDAACIAWIAGFQTLTWLLLEATLFRHDALFDSREGFAARLMLLAPALIVLVRNGFHDPGSVWLAATIACPSVVLLVWPKLRGRQSAAFTSMQLTGAGGLLVALTLFNLPALVLMLSLSTALLATGELVTGRPAVLAWSAACFFAAAATIAYGADDWLSCLAIIPLGALHALAAFRRRRGWLFTCNVVATCAGVIGHLAQLVVFPKHDVWIAGAVLSVTLLALASLVESQKAQLQRVAARLRQHFHAEEAS